MSASPPGLPLEPGRSSSVVAARGKSLLGKALSRLPAGARTTIYTEASQAYSTLRRGTSTFANTQYDLFRYYRHSWLLLEPNTPEHMRYFLRMRYHTFEKGLSLPEPRPGFGQRELAVLLKMLAKYESKVGYDDLVAVVVNVLTRYQQFNAAHDIAIEHLDVALAGYRQKYPQIDTVAEGGTVNLTREKIERITDIDFHAFAYSRHSIRNYGPKPVDAEQIRRAVRIAQKAPSVCNRQAGRVHVFTDPEHVKEVLSFQRGHRGFGHTVPCVMVITADLQSYYKPGERFQGWVDGGLFAMSLIFGLHAEGLGTCCLNWNVTRKEDAPMRKAVGIPPNEVVITMLAVGNLPEVLEVAESPRRPLSEVLFFRDGAPEAPSISSNGSQAHTSRPPAVPGQPS